MTKILSSRNPGHVELKATIGYQENQIKNLLDRIEVLSREVGALTLDRNAQKQDRIKQIDIGDSRLRMLEEAGEGRGRDAPDRLIMTDRCPRGHLFNVKNTYVRHRDGKTYRTCRKCESIRRQFRYRTDPDLRETKKTRELKRYYDNKGYPL